MNVPAENGERPVTVPMLAGGVDRSPVLWAAGGSGTPDDGVGDGDGRRLSGAVVIPPALPRLDPVAAACC